MGSLIQVLFRFDLWQNIIRSMIRANVKSRREPFESMIGKESLKITKSPNYV
jgi:hypothetical protein